MSDELKEIEPHVKGLGAIRFPMAGIVNYVKSVKNLQKLLKKWWGDTVKYKSEEDTRRIRSSDRRNIRGTIEAKMVINCAGFHSDRVAAAAGYKTDMKIVPISGEYYKLEPEKRYLVKNLFIQFPIQSFHS